MRPDLVRFASTKAAPAASSGWGSWFTPQGTMNAVMTSLAMVFSFKLVGQAHKHEEEKDELRAQMMIQIDASQQLAHDADARHQRLLEQAPDLAVNAGLRESARGRFAAALKELEQKPQLQGVSPEPQRPEPEPQAQLPKDKKVTVW